MKRSVLLYNAWKNRKLLQDPTTKDKFNAFLRMVPLLLKGDYKPKRKRHIIIGLAAAVYAVSPVDLLPAVVFGPIGFLDDLIILTYGLKKIDKEIHHFLLWEQEQKELLFH
ncbi:MAG: DUF1232 domain-containing protein [Weeksellaceae bacterium]|nr:DUF1232 domain-containing protein [Weeksellaceae bacterium]